MTSFSPDRGILSSLGGLRLAFDGPELHGLTVPMALLSESNRPRPSRELQIMELYDSSRPSLLTYLGGLGLTLNEAEDVVQECFLRLFDHLAAKEADRNLRGWLFRVAHNLAIDVFRDARRIHQPGAEHADFLDSVEDASFSPEEHAIKNEEIQRVAAALGHLTQQQRAAVLLRAEDLRYREIAAILGVSIKRVSELVQRALVLLAANL